MSSSNDRTHSRGWYWGVQDKQLTTRQAWMTLAVMFVFGFMSMFGFIRVAPVMTVLWGEFGFGLANGGLIQTFYTMAGVILMFPGTWIMRNVGVKITIVGACIISLIGALVGIFAGNQVVFLLSRTIEGIGAGLIMFLGATVCTRIFPQKKLGIAMAVWSIWAPAGVFLALFASPHLYSIWGWRSLWIITAIAYAVCLVWLLLCFKLPKTDENILTVQRLQVNGSNIIERIKTPKLMIVSSFVMAFSFLTWGFLFGGSTNSFYPTYLVEVKGLSLTESGFWPSMISLITLPLGILAGFLSDKLGTRKWFVTISYLLMAVVMAFVAWRESTDMMSVYVFVVMMSLFSACIPMGTRAAIPEYTPDPKISDYALTTMVVIANLGQALGVVFGATVAAFGGGGPATGWANAGLWLLAPTSLVTGLALLIFCKNDFKKNKAAALDN